ncbi:unnamed protein product [Musa acuminata subsp. burmannicoides]
MRYCDVYLHSSFKVDFAPNGIMKNASKLTPTDRGGQSRRISHLPTCFKCKQIGHCMNEYLNRQVDARVNFAEEEDANEQLEDIGEPIYDEYTEEASEEIALEEGECLVIHKALATPRDDSNEE